MDILTGLPEDHPHVLPVDASAAPGVQRPTPVSPAASGLADSGSQVGGVRNCTAERLEQLSASQEQIAGALAVAHSADSEMRTHLAATMAPLAASYGDQLVLPPVPAFQLPPPPQSGYEDSGDEPIVS